MRTRLRTFLHRASQLALVLGLAVGSISVCEASTGPAGSFSSDHALFEHSDGTPNDAGAVVVAEDSLGAPEDETPARRGMMGALGAAAVALASFAFGTIRQGMSKDGGTLYRPAFHAPQDAVPTRIDPSSFKGSDWVDADGVLKPGTPLKADGTLAGDAVDETAERVLPFAVGIAEGSTDALLDAAPNGDVAANTRGDIVRSHVEGNLGRVLTANELAAFAASGRFVLV